MQKHYLKAFRGKVHYWISLNEQNIFTSLGYLLAAHPPGVTDPKQMYEVNHIANLANASVINKYHELEIPGKIGPSFAYTPNYQSTVILKMFWQPKMQKI